MDSSQSLHIHFIRKAAFLFHLFQNAIMYTLNLIHLLKFVYSSSCDSYKGKLASLLSC